MKKRLMAFVLAFAMFGGFSEGMTPAKPAAAGVCDPGYIWELHHRSVDAWNEKGKIKARLHMFVEVCRIDTNQSVDIYIVYHADSSDIYDNKWVYDAAATWIRVLDWGGGLDYEIKARWRRYNKNDEFKGYACGHYKLRIYPNGNEDFQTINYDPDC